MIVKTARALPAVCSARQWRADIAHVWPDMTRIHQRPPQRDERIIPGPWEGDPIQGRAQASAVDTGVERASLLVALVTLDNAGTAVAVTGFTQAELDAAAWPLNMRLRTSPGWKCPTELFMPESFDFI
ncbi:MAG: hypothetical protein EPO03_11015 [Porticoccaceae bacterium]|nr:MAG: hypothetical protein EPO03_11015 [Porticoccaceae bacterium]